MVSEFILGCSYGVKTNTWWYTNNEWSNGLPLAIKLNLKWGGGSTLKEHSWHLTHHFKGNTLENWSSHFFFLMLNQSFLIKTNFLLNFLLLLLPAGYKRWPILCSLLVPFFKRGERLFLKGNRKQISSWPSFTQTHRHIPLMFLI